MQATTQAADNMQRILTSSGRCHYEAMTCQIMVNQLCLGVHTRSLSGVYSLMNWQPEDLCAPSAHGCRA